MASSSEQRPLTDHLETVLQGLIPGLATMEDPVHPQSGRGQEAVVIDMPYVNAGEENRNSNEMGGGQGGDGEDAERSDGVGEGQLRAIRPLLERTVPFILILLVKILYDHRLGKCLHLAGILGLCEGIVAQGRNCNKV